MATAILSIIVTPITEIVKCLIPPIKRRIDRLIHCEQKIKELTRKVTDLNDIRGRIQSKADAAEKNLDTVRGVVRTWLQRVEDETNTQNNNNKIVRLAMNGEAIEMINQQRCKGWCFCGSVRASYDLGEEADNKIVIIDELLTDGRRIATEDVSDPAMPTEIAPSSYQDFEDFTSRESVRNEVMAALKEEGTNIIGVHGMGGVGKTTLLEQIHKQVKEENLFDDVAFTTVSQNIDLKRIQGEIAEDLGCLEKLKQTDNIKKRAALLHQRLNRQDKRRTLVILDDLWSTQNLLNLSDVGIHPKAGCCKVVITTRSIEVCESLHCQKKINVGVLSKDESWHLFERSSGVDVVNFDPGMKSVPEEITEECGGLPLALVTLGRALINKDMTVWKDTLRQLKNIGSSNNFIGITKDSLIYLKIKLSYDLLGNEILKKWFLLCCLFPEDYEIVIDDLMPYVIEDLRNLEQVKSRLHTALVKLKAASLLLAVEGYGKLTEVRMHDIVRDVAILIASEEGNTRFFVKAGLGLKSWEDAEIPGGYLQRLSLMNNHITGELPDQPQLPHLLSLSLRGNENIQKIPNNFFQSMISLTTLDLSETGISSLPSSLFSLVNLRSLYLNSFGGLDISGIGMLNELIILSLQNSELQKIPEELGRLTNLRMLDLRSSHYLNTIPPNVISRMTRLECLKVISPEWYGGCFNKWEVEGWGINGTNASLAEVVSLPYLTDLGLKLKHERTTTDQDRVEQIEFEIKSNKCTLGVSDPTAICDSIKVLLGRQKEVTLKNCMGLKNIDQLVSLGVEFKNTKSLTLEYWNEMEYFLSSDVSEEEEEQITRNAFLSLEKLTFHLMPSMKDGVFNFENDNGDKEGSTSVAMCSKLRDIHLSCLPNLESIYRKGGVIPLGCVENLKVISIDRCLKLRYLFSASTARRFQQSEELRIIRCTNLLSIIKTEEEAEEINTDVDDQIFFPNLRVLVIENCENLEQLWDNNDTKPTSLIIPQLDLLSLEPQSIGDSLLKEIKGWEDASWEPIEEQYVRKQMKRMEPQK